jgi:hypothetical protein
VPAERNTTGVGTAHADVPTAVWASAHDPDDDTNAPVPENQSDPAKLAPRETVASTDGVTFASATTVPSSRPGADDEPPNDTPGSANATEHHDGTPVGTADTAEPPPFAASRHDTDPDGAGRKLTGPDSVNAADVPPFESVAVTDTDHVSPAVAEDDTSTLHANTPDAGAFGEPAAPANAAGHPTNVAFEPDTCVSDGVPSSPEAFTENPSGSDTETFTRTVVPSTAGTPATADPSGTRFTPRTTLNALEVADANEPEVATNV